MKFDLVVTEPRQTGAIFVGTLGKRYLIVVPNEKKNHSLHPNYTYVKKKKFFYELAVNLCDPLRTDFATRVSFVNC